LSESDKTLGHFTDKVQLVKKVLSLWSYRDLTCIGKVTLIKTLPLLALPILVQCLTVLPKPPVSVLNDIKDIQKSFIIIVYLEGAVHGNPALSQAILLRSCQDILVQCLTVLPKPPVSVLNDIKDIFHTFLWNSKKRQDQEICYYQ
jgi:hypothetical protein